MKNRAKCKLCGSVIESVALMDYIACDCGEIAIAGGAYELLTYAKDFTNFLRVDDLGNEIVVQYKEQISSSDQDEKPDEPKERMTREECLYMLDHLIKNIEDLPDHVKMSPINHYDLISFMLVISNILKRE